MFSEKDRPGRTAIIYDRLKVKDSARKAPAQIKEEEVVPVKEGEVVEKVKAVAALKVEG